MIGALFFYFFAVVPTAVFASGSGFVGNGGDGIERGEQLLVRDLFDFGAWKAPYFGDKTDPALPSLPETIAFRYPQDLLARKLTDLNQAAPGLGDYVLATMKLYSWVLVDFPLAPISDPLDDPVILPPDARVVQIANRFHMSIQIQSGLWQRLDDENKIALLIHEAIFSLVQPTSMGEFARQSPQTAREITASFFQPALYLKDPRRTYSTLKDALAIPPQPPNLKVMRGAPEWNLSRTSSPASCPDCESLNKVSFDAKDWKGPGGLPGFLANYCRQLEALQAGNPGLRYYVYGLVTSLSSPHIKTVEYNAAEANPQTQTYVQITEASLIGKSSKMFTFQNADSCISELGDQLTAASSTAGR